MSEFAKELTTEREKTHGDWKKQAHCSRLLKELVADYDDGLSFYQREALEMICVKISRILCGDPNEPDHWDDIAGYAHLGKGGHDGNS